MPGELRSALIVGALVTGLLLLGSCADVLGLDEPTVREGSGGGATSTGAAPTSATGTASGPGGGGPGSSGTSPTTGSSGGQGGQGGDGGGGGRCDTPAQCDDDNPCTDDACLEGVCSHTPIADGPLVDDPTDCRTISCVAGELLSVPNDDEKPGDANPPCELTICEGGRTAPVFADGGTPCGPDPLVCDGRGFCVGCNPDVPREQCGGASLCSAPICEEPGVCNPGYLPADTALADPVDGDCQRQGCTGRSAAPVSVADDTDVPSDLPCGDRGCSGGAPTTTTLAAGTPCIGQLGVCDGNGTGSVNCRVCQNTTENMLDLGCSEATPNCDAPSNGFGTACRECVQESHCEGSEVGEDCLNGFVCGCNGGSDCTTSPSGDYCRLGQGVCGCQGNADCVTAARGDDCDLATSLCSCDAALDCEDSSWGGECLAGVCGCANDLDCLLPTQTCNLTTSRCE